MGTESNIYKPQLVTIAPNRTAVTTTPKKSKAKVVSKTSRVPVVAPSTYKPKNGLMNRAVAFLNPVTNEIEWRFTNAPSNNAQSSSSPDVYDFQPNKKLGQKDIVKPATSTTTTAKRPVNNGSGIGPAGFITGLGIAGAGVYGLSKWLDSKDPLYNKSTTATSSIETTTDKISNPTDKKTTTIKTKGTDKTKAKILYPKPKTAYDQALEDMAANRPTLPNKEKPTTYSARNVGKLAKNVLDWRKAAFKAPTPKSTPLTSAGTSEFGTPIVRKTMSDATREAFYKGARGTAKLNALAVPVQLLAEAGVRKEAWSQLVSQYGEEGAKQYLQVARRRNNSLNKKHLSEATRAALSTTENFYPYGGKLNKGFGDIIGGAASGAGMGTSILPGWGTAIGAVVGGISGLFKGRKRDSFEEERLRQQEAQAKENQHIADISYMANYNAIPRESLYPYGGNVTEGTTPNNPVPNKLIIIKSKKIKTVNGEPTTHYIDHADTLVGQDYGQWGENLQGINIPKALPVDANGKIILPKPGKAVPGTAVAVRALGGGVNNNVAIPQGNAKPINPDAEIVLNNNGGTKGLHETGQNIPVIAADGTKTAQVEPGEVLMKDSKGTEYALSKRLGFAQKYIDLDNTVKSLTTKLNAEPDRIKRNTIIREIDKVKRNMDKLPAKQEITKMKLGVTDGINAGWGDILNIGRLNNQLTEANKINFAGMSQTIPLSANAKHTSLQPRPLDMAAYNIGRDKPGFLDKAWDGINGQAGKLGGWGNIAQMALPFITNAINNRTLNKSMDSINKLQVTPLRYRNLDNKVDVSGQVGDINSSYREAVEGTRGLSDARTAAMMKGTFASNRVGALNTVRETANNASRAITNQNITAVNAYDAQNASAADALNKYKLEAQVGLNNAKIAGRNQTVENIYSMIKDRNLSDADKYTMNLIIKTIANKRSLSKYFAGQYELITGEKYTGEITD